MPYKNIIIAIFLSLFLQTTMAQSKLSPFVRRAVQAETLRTSHARHAKAQTVPTHPRTITAFVRTTDTDALISNGCRIYAQWDDIVIASIPLNKVMTLADMPQVKRIEANQSCSINNDTITLVTHARDVWNLQSTSSLGGLRGSGVVVGVMDIGFDLTHPTFYSADGQTYRIKRLWDQLDLTNNGDPVTGKTANGEDTIYIGRQYIGQAALLDKQHPADGLTQTHGTHTTGTAAGSGWEGTNNSVLTGAYLYSGTAPSSDICLVCNMADDNKSIVPDSLISQYTTATDMLGFKYIFDYADSQGKPCVINFSEGAYDDLHDSKLYGEVLTKMLGPGHILCASAGNENGGDGNYMHKKPGEASKGAFMAKWAKNSVGYTMKSSYPVSIRLSFYKDNTKQLDKDYDLTQLAQFPDSIMNDSIIISGDTIALSLQTYPSCYDSTTCATQLYLKQLNDKHYGFSIPTILTVLGEDNDIEVFGAGGLFIHNNIDPSLTDYDCEQNILFPGCVKDVICVGNCAYRTTYQNTVGEWRAPYATEDKDGIISRYSSTGPALSGLTKPDVVAPGQNIISSYSSFFREHNPDHEVNDDVRDFTFNGRHYQWHAFSGTSMSSPAVVGIIALWLQVCPTLSPEQIRDIFAHTCYHYDQALTYPNNIYGYGMIDALAGIEYIQKTYTGIVQMENRKWEMGNDIYTLDGRKMNDISNLHGIFIITENGVTKKVIR